MAWFGSRLLNWPKTKARSTPGVPARTDAGETVPALVLLAPDGFGTASYRMHSFPGGEPVLEFLDANPGIREQRGVVAFWASAWEPLPLEGAGGSVEAVVLIKDEARDVVYTFSFAVMEVAQEFIRSEVSRGLDPALVSAYWAARPAILMDSEGVITVGDAPERRSVGREPVAARFGEGSWQPPDARPQAFPGSLIDDELAALFEELENTRASWMIRTPAWQDRWERIAALYDGGPPTGGDRPHIIKPECVDDLLAEIDAAIAMAPSDSEPQDELPGLDMTDEVIKVLRQKRWDWLGDPFRGFGSPPGRF